MRAHASRSLIALAGTFLAMLLVPQLAGAVTVSGTAMLDERGSSWQRCDGVTPNVRLHLQGGATLATTCNGLTGTFSFTSVTIPAAGALLTIWLEGGAAGGALYARPSSTVADITGTTVTQNRISIHDAGTVLQASDLVAWDSSDDADIPVEADSGALTLQLDPNIELHVEAGADLHSDNWNISTDSVHVESGGTLKLNADDNEALILTGIGTGACDFGPGVARPLCLDGPTTDLATNFGGVYYASDEPGRYTVSALDYHMLTIEGHRDGVGEIGSAAAQTLRTAAEFVIASVVDSDPWATAIDAEWIRFDAWQNDADAPSEAKHARWTGTSQFTITVNGGIHGAGSVELPGATVQLYTDAPTASFGPQHGNGIHPEWTFRTVDIRNVNYRRSAFGSGATGMTTPINSAAANADVVATVVEGTDGTTFVVYNLPTNGGDWGIVRYFRNGTPDMDWDDGDANGVDNDANAVLTWNSGGATADVAYVAVADCGITVAGSSGGDWRVRRWNCDGAVDTSLAGTGQLTWNGGGADEVRGMQIENGEVRLVGTGGATSGFRVRVYDESSGTLGNSFAWSPANGAMVRGICKPFGGEETFVVGQVLTTPGDSDWAVRRISWDWSSWENMGGAGPWTQDFGATGDEAIGCHGDTDDITVVGTTGTGASDDIRAAGFDPAGNLDTTFGTAGFYAYNGAGDDNVFGVVGDDHAANVVIVGSDPTNGGQMSLRRVDTDGDLDTSWGTGGVITWDATVNEESGRAAEYVEGHFVVGVRHGQNGGDVALRRYDYSGALTTDTSIGTTRILGRNSVRDDTVRVHLTEGLEGLEIGDNGIGPVLLDVESEDLGLDIDGKFLLGFFGRFRASSDRDLEVRNDFTIDNAALFWANQGRVLLSGQEFRMDVQVAPSTEFWNLSIVAPEKFVVFDATDDIAVAGTFYVRGTSCGAPIDLDSNTGGNQWDLTLVGAGTADVQFAAFDDSRALPGATATNSYARSNNSNWTIAGCGVEPLYAPSGFQTDGVYHQRGVTSTTPSFSWYNRSGRNVDRGDVEVWTSPNVNQRALWHLDSNGTDSSGSGFALTPNDAGATYVAGGGIDGTAGADLTGATDGFGTGDLDLADDFTIDGWFKTDLSTPSPWPDLIYKGNGAGSLVNYRLGFDNVDDELEYDVTGGGDSGEIVVDATPYIDDQWHHVAVTFRDGRSVLYVDGRALASSKIAALVPDTGTWTTNIGYQLGGRLDDWRLSSVAYGPEEILGYYRTGRPHATKVWDADPADGTGVALAGAPWANGTRPAVTYGGATNTLILDGARYWVRSRFRTTAGASPANTWSNWSQWDWFETAQSTTVSVPGGTSIGMGGTLPGADTLATSTFRVTTSNIHGYSAYVTGPSDTWGMSDGVPGANHQIPGRGSPAGTLAWPAGTSGYFGLSVLSATGGKNTTTWGTGTTVNDLATLMWGTPWKSEPLLLNARTAYDPTAQDIVTALRVNVDNSTDPGRYTTTLTFTAVPNV